MSELKCPFSGQVGAVTPAGGTTNDQWWPDHIKVGLLHQHHPASNPLGADFDYAKAFAEVSHILADGTLETHAHAETRLMVEYRLGEDDLFVPEAQRVENAYAKRAADIAYQETNEEAKA